MLGPGTAIELDVLLDLRLSLFALSGLVDRELDVVLAVRHDDRHESGILCRNVLIVECDVTEKAHDIAIEVTPLAHLPKLDVTHDVIDHHDAGGVTLDVLIDEAR